MVLDPRHRRQHALSSLTDHHGALADSQLSANIVTLTGTQTLTNKTLTAPTLADFTNAQHDHQDADDGGVLAHAAIGTAWTDFTLRVTQSGDFTTTGGSSARWCQLGKVVHVLIHAGLTSAGTAANDIAVVLAATVPAVSQTGSWFRKGGFTFYDASTATIYEGAAVATAARTIRFLTNGSSVAGGYFGIAPAITGANGDELHVALTYETA
jgi:hypothetical protein